MKTYLLVIISILTVASSCKTRSENEKVETTKAKKIIERKKPAAPIQYHVESGKAWVALHTNETTRHIVSSVNRADAKHLVLKDSIIVPDDTTAGIEFYMPFPLALPGLKYVDKIIFFSYPAQAFAAYENGELVYTGATNMGRKKDMTPTGLFFTNWKAEKTTSTFNDEWELKWNFNIENKLGVGWHEYPMPGYPASHSCLRLLEKDARYLYTWANQWVLDEKEQIKTNGTPVIVFGSYDFAGDKPWKKLVGDAHALDVSEEEMQNVAMPYLNEIKGTKTVSD
jgi:lipoprotein-anchoring transpeptidase ErfK/SrfK